jgi:hypothetical protein
MTAAGPLHVLLLAVSAGAGALCGFLAAAVVLRKKRRARGYFVLGVLAGVTAAAVARGRYRKLYALSALARRLPVVVAAPTARSSAPRRRGQRRSRSADRSAMGPIRRALTQWAASG